MQHGNPGAHETWAFRVALVFLLGLLLFSYPPLVIRSGDTRLFRPDWVLALPVLAYVPLVKRRVTLSRPVLLAGLFVGITVISVVVNPLRSAFDFLTLFLQLVFAVGLFTALANLELDRETFRRLLQVWVGLLTVIAAYSMYEAVAINVGLPFSELYPKTSYPYTGSYNRPTATFGEPGFLSSLLVTGIAVLVPSLGESGRILFSKWGRRGSLAVLTAGVFVSLGLSGYVTLFVALVVLPVYPALRWRVLRAWLLVGGLVVGGTVLAMAFEPALLDRLVGRFERMLSAIAGTVDGEAVTATGSIGIRWWRILSGFKALAANPPFGVGWGQFTPWATTASFDHLSISNVSGRLNGGYIQVLAQTGLVGGVTFALIWIQVIRESFHRVATSTGVDRVLALSCTSLVVFLLIGWAHSFSAIHTVRWGLLGLCYGYVSTG
jgi:hypothetical protein